MNRTLFRYIFLDLLRVFLVTNGALSGIMGFAGLLKPLTQNGLDAAQVGRLLAYFTPSMMAYSFPIAALFATTVVYGRLNADNEIIAARACGVPQFSLVGFSLATPAMVLGLLVSLLSLLFLCYVVPQFTLRVEKVIYSNFAQVLANKIERNHEIRLDNGILYAQKAVVAPADPNDPFVQRVVLEGPAIVNYDIPDKKDKSFRVPEEFWMARKATLYIRSDPNSDRAELSAVLDGGMKFPRKTIGGWQGGVAQTQFGPIVLPSFIRENVKFMDIERLKELDADKSKSRKIAMLRDQFVADEQEARFLEQVEREFREGLVRSFQSVARVGSTTTDDAFTIIRSGDEIISRRSGRLILSSATPGKRTIHVQQIRGGATVLDADVGELRMRVRADADGSNFNVGLELSNVLLNEVDGPIERGSLQQGFAVPMSQTLRQLSTASPEDYATADPAAPDPRRALKRELILLNNNIASEMHSRAAFATSCFVLVIVGTALGMMFRSGNVLSAFALSFIPALLCITLIIAGQRTSGNIPWEFWKFSDPLRLGLGLIWSGNVVAAVIGGVLMWRVSKT